MPRTTPHTIRSILVAPKHKDHPQDTCGVVYKLTCHDCEASYIGETKRALKQGLKEHQKTHPRLAIIWGIISTR